jgi:hypothetical protein
MILGMIVGAAGFVLFLGGHIAVMRLLPAAGRPRAAQYLFLAGLLGIPAALGPLIASAQNPVLTQGGLAAGTLCGALVYAGLLILYMPFYYVVAASLSVRTVVLLRRCEDGALPLSALRDEFVSRALIGRRLQTMVENGFLRPAARGYGLTGKGRRVAVFFDFVKRIGKLGPGG